MRPTRPARARWCGLLLLGQLLAAGPALGGSEKGERARALTTDGTAALERRDFPAAYQALAAAYRLRPAPETLYWLGALALAQGQLLQAQDLFRRYLDDPNLEAADAQQRAEAQRVTAQPRPPAGKLAVLGERGTVVSVDGRVVGALPLTRPLLLSPAEHTVALDSSRGAPGAQEAKIQVAAGRFAELRQAGGSGALLLALLPGVLTSEVYTGVPAASRPLLARATEDAVQAEHMSALPPDGAACGGAEAACLDRLLEQARRRELDYVLLVRCTAVPVADARAPAGTGPWDWELHLRLIDVSVGAEASAVERSCPGGNLERAAAALSGGIAPLLAQAQGLQRGLLAVRSNPPGAQVRSRGRVLGRTPLQRALFAGPAEITVAQAGYREQRQTVDIAAGRTATLEVDLAPLVAARPAPVRGAPLLPRPGWRLILGGGLLGAGALVLGFGASGLAVAGQCVEAAQPPALLCRQYHDTTGIGAGLTAVGGAALVTGAVLLAVPGSSAPPQVTGARAGGP